jgi:predicted xylose isomerase-like sugar epimerase
MPFMIKVAITIKEINAIKSFTFYSSSMDKKTLLDYAQQIVAKAKELTDKYTNKTEVRANYVCIFCQSNDEYENLIALATSYWTMVMDTPS